MIKENRDYNTHVNNQQTKNESTQNCNELKKEVLHKENIDYYIRFVRNQQNSSFGGSALLCDEFIEETIHDAVAMMDRYSEQNNRWWLKYDERMAYFQLIEISYMIVDYTLFTAKLSILLDRPIQSFEIGQNYWSTLQEAKKAYDAWQEAQQLKTNTNAPEISMTR